jgi:hypothetical protein
LSNFSHLLMDDLIDILTRKKTASLSKRLAEIR